MARAWLRFSRGVVRAAIGSGWVVGLSLGAGCAGETDPVSTHPACGAGEVASGAVCRPADAALRLAVQQLHLGALRFGGDGDRPLRIGHPVAATIELHLQAPPLRASIAVSAHSASRKTACILGLMEVDTTSRPPQAGSQKVMVSGPLTVPVGCSALTGATDLEILTTFDPRRQLYVAQREDRRLDGAANAADPTRVQQSLACGGKGKVLRANGCGTAAIAASEGVDLILRDAALTSSVAVIEYLGERPKPVAARPASVTRAADGSAKTGVEVAAVDPDSLAPTLADTPLATASIALVQGGSAAEPLGPVAVDLAIRPAGTGEPWQAIDHHAVEDAAGKMAKAALRVVDGAEVAKGVGLTVQASLPDAVRQRMTTGDWRKPALFDMRICASVGQAEKGLDADAKGNNCATVQLAAVRVKKEYGVHRYPPAGKDSANAPTSDYLELGKSNLVPIAGGAMIMARVFRGGYREVADGHVRLGGKAWANLLFFITTETGHVLEAGAYHDTAPAAPDFVSGYLTVLSLLTLDLDKYPVPESFKFALNAAVDTKTSKNQFGGTANLGPLVDALNFVGKQASTDGLKWCFFDVICVTPPLQMPANLKLGFALAKATTVPDCELITDVGCYGKQQGQSGHFWGNSSACAGIGATLPADHNSATAAAGLRKIANKWQTPFYLGLYRAGKDYHYLMSKVFFDDGWKTYGTDLPTKVPTWWAFLDASLEPENGACAAVAPDDTAATFTSEYTGPLVADLAKTKPWVAADAAKSHVGCEAKLPYVCEYPVDKDQVMYESSEIYLQQTGKLVIDGTVSYTKEQFNLKGTVGLTGYILKATWAASGGMSWVAVADTKKKWRTKGNVSASVSLVGKIGEFTLWGQGCVLLGIPKQCLGDLCSPELGHWECLDISLGGLTNVLATNETGMNYSMDFLPFDIKQN